MGRKKGPPSPPSKHVRLELDPENHRLLRIIAAHHSQTMSDVAKDAVVTRIQSEIIRLGIDKSKRETD